MRNELINRRMKNIIILRMETRREITLQLQPNRKALIMFPFCQSLKSSLSCSLKLVNSNSSSSSSDDEHSTKLTKSHDKLKINKKLIKIKSVSNSHILFSTNNANKTFSFPLDCSSSLSLNNKKTTKSNVNHCENNNLALNDSHHDNLNNASIQNNTNSFNFKTSSLFVRFIRKKLLNGFSK